MLNESENFIQLDGNVTISSEISDELNDNCESFKIPIITNYFERKTSFSTRKPCRNTVRRSNRILEATNLPLMLVLNPRSIYNKLEEFWIMMEQLEVDICYMSESWDRENLPLETLLQKEGYKIIKKCCAKEEKRRKTSTCYKRGKIPYKTHLPRYNNCSYRCRSCVGLTYPKK